MKEIGHWINGKHVKGTSGRFADVFNPATGAVQGHRDRHRRRRSGYRCRRSRRRCRGQDLHAADRQNRSQAEYRCRG